MNTQRTYRVLQRGENVSHLLFCHEGLGDLSGGAVKRLSDLRAREQRERYNNVHHSLFVRSENMLRMLRRDNFSIMKKRSQEQKGATENTP